MGHVKKGIQRAQPRGLRTKGICRKASALPSRALTFVRNQRTCAYTCIWVMIKMCIRVLFALRLCGTVRGAAKTLAAGAAAQWKGLALLECNQSLSPSPTGQAPKKTNALRMPRIFHCSWAPLGIIVTSTAHGHHWASPGTAEIVGLATGYLFAEPHIKKLAHSKANPDKSVCM